MSVHPGHPQYLFEAISSRSLDLVSYNFFLSNILPYDCTCTRRSSYVLATDWHFGKGLLIWMTDCPLCISSWLFSTLAFMVRKFASNLLSL